MPANSFQDKGGALWNALVSGDMTEAKRMFDDIMRILDSSTGGTGSGNAAPVSGTRVSRVPQALLDRSAGRAQSPLNIQASTKGQGVVEGKQTSFDTSSGHPLRKALVADGEAVTPGCGVTVLDNVAYLCDGGDSSLRCDGVCERGTGKDKEIYWRPMAGTVIARVKRSTDVSSYGALYVSTTPGVFTNDSAETGLSYIQQVGHFKKWVSLPGNTAADLAEVSMNVQGTSGSGGGTTSWTGTAGEAIAANQLVCVDYNGNVWLADASNQFRFCTHMAVTAAAEGASVTYTDIGEYDVPSDSDDPYDHTNTFYLSDSTPGACTANPPDTSDGTKLRQIVGFAVENRDSGDGTTLIALSICPDWVYV